MKLANNVSVQMNALQDIWAGLFPPNQFYHNAFKTLDICSAMQCDVMLCNARYCVMVRAQASGAMVGEAFNSKF